jgi:hypothetical protein
LEGRTILFQEEFAKSADADEVYAAGTVTSHQGTSVRICDPGHAIAAAWDAGSYHSRHRSALYAHMTRAI